jgi:hypothetical protein
MTFPGGGKPGSSASVVGQLVAHAPDQSQRRGLEVLDEVADEGLPTLVCRIVFELSHRRLEIVALDEMEEVASVAPDAPVSNPDSPMRLDQVGRDSLVRNVIARFAAGTENGAQRDRHVMPGLTDLTEHPLRA